MKKQYKAPSVEVELLGVSNFCAGCADDILSVTKVFDNQSCIELYNSFFDSELEGEEVICYNAPNSTFSVTTS